MNGTTEPQRNHTRFIVSCVTILGTVCASGGTILIFKGYGGDLLIGGALSAISGLCGYLGAGRPNTPSPDISVSSQPPAVVVGQTKVESPTV
jgi:hypothetical protein